MKVYVVTQSCFQQCSFAVVAVFKHKIYAIRLKDELSERYKSNLLFEVAESEYIAGR